MIKILNEKSLSNKHMRLFILFSILITALGLLSPVLSSNDSNFYAVVAKHIVLNNDFINLKFNNQDWLDKPHLQFWLTAISFKIFGINVFAYILPGFLFYVLGGGYLYLLTKYMFGSKEVGLLSTLIYFTSLHLMISAIDVRQEAFLLGEIIPACYYLLLYYKEDGILFKYLILTAIFSALAVMTKGIFVLLIIFSGLIGLWLVSRQIKKIFTKKFVLLLAMVFIFIIPELIVLFIQFDLHPEKLVFGKHSISGIKWFFWDSQFGRFFNTGPITSNKNGTIAHYFYYLHTILWAFLPWSMVLIFALFNMIKSIRFSKEVPENLQRKSNRNNYIYLLFTIIPTFILFSLTKFQLDHYINIIIPFLAIICADFLFNELTKLNKHPIFVSQIGLAYLLCGLIILLSLIILTGKLFVVLTICACTIVVIFLILTRNYPLTRALVYPILAIWLVFSFVEIVNDKLYAKYDLGRLVTDYIMTRPTIIQYHIESEKYDILPNYPIIDYNVNSLSLEFFALSKYNRVNNITQLNKISKPYYLVINKADWDSIRLNNPDLNSGLLLNTFKSIAQNKFIPLLFNNNKKQQNTSDILLILVKDS